MRNKVKYVLAALALVVLAAVSPMKAQAAGGLELYTDYPGISVKAGDSQSISMYVSNDSGSAVEASLSILSMPEGWTGYFSGNGSQISRVHVQNGEAASRKFDSSINRKTLAGSIKPVFFLSNFMHIIVAIYSYMLYNRGRRYLP